MCSSGEASTFLAEDCFDKEGDLDFLDCLDGRLFRGELIDKPVSFCFFTSLANCDSTERRFVRDSATFCCIKLIGKNLIGLFGEPSSS